ncbi:tetratricopeptide repeat protein [Nocardiopsis sp. NPDC006139]|uniref:tetratricopeptide repeat protein n=1 Tax=Nocardiopsis sp. NPDC006139 TaxID=3154578 RepID=UPI0033AF052E
MAGGPPDEIPVEYGVFFGEPYDEWLAKAGTLLELHRFREARDILDRLLEATGGLDPSPVVDLLRGTLLSDLGRARVGLADLTGGAADLDRALALLRPLGPHVTGPTARPVWTGILVHTLIERAENARRLGDTGRAAALLDEAGARADDSVTPEVHRAEAAGGRALLLVTRGEWGAAEELYRSALAATDPGLHPVPYLLSGLADLLAETGRLDEAEDLLARAAERFRAHGGEPPSLDGGRAHLALLRGDVAEAERLYLRASVAFERGGDPVSLAACEQVRAALARVSGSTDTARALAAASRARFEEHGVRAALGEGLLEDARRALAAGDLPAVREHASRARALFEEQGAFERCAQVDLLMATSAAALAEAGAFPGREHELLRTALATAVPVALALAAVRADFATGHARARWGELSRAAADLAFRLAWSTGDQGLLFELVEVACAGAPLAVDRAPGPADPVAALFPPPAAHAPGLRVGPVPRVEVSPGRFALQEHIAAAEARYRRPVVSEGSVAPVAGADRAYPEPVPTVLVRLADAGGLYMSWRWTAGAQGFGTGYAPGPDTDAVLAELSAALPGPEGIAAALDGALADPSAERALAARLSEVLWPAELTDQIRTVARGLGMRPLVRVQPSPRTGRVPWELLAADPGGTRLLDLADVSLAAPAALTAGPRPEPAPGGPAVLVLDPRVPGFRADSELGSVLGRPGTDPDVLALVEAHRAADDMLPRVAAPQEALRRTDQDRHWLGGALRAGARRLLYVGHATSAPVEDGQSEDTLLHLCCTADTGGHAEPVRGHRPLSAKDLLLGTPDGRPGHEVWPSPARVALIACDSGADTRFAEPFGPASALLRNGADLVTAARWALPTNAAFHRFGGVPAGERPLTELIAAVDAAHDAPAPVRALADWQRTRLDRWRTTGDPAAVPLLWAAPATATAGPR